MVRHARFRAAAVLTFMCFVLSVPVNPAQERAVGQVPMETREEAYRANNIGVALLEQFDYRAAVDSFHRSLSLDPQLELARINLAIALYNLPDYEAALEAAGTAAEIFPGRPQPHYILGLIARNRNHTEAAADAFRKVLAIDPADVGANVNLGQVLMQERKYQEATELFRAAVRSEPYNSTALYNLATALLRQGRRDEGQKQMTRFQALRQSGAATNIGPNYFEQGRYAEALVSTGTESGLVDPRPPKVTFEFADVVAAKGAAGKSRAVRSVPNAGALFDFDDDGDLDLVHISGGAMRLFRNEGGRFAEVAAAFGGPARFPPAGVGGTIAGDYDNDGHNDLLVFGGAPRLLHGDGKGGFKDVTFAAKLSRSLPGSRAGAFLDADHDGDLDIFLGGTARTGNALFRNNGDGTFADISVNAKINAASKAVAVVPTDFDNRRDMDVMVIRAGTRTQLWRNMRDTTFRDVAAEVGLDRVANWASAAAGDINKDGFVDFFLGEADGPGILAMSDGRGKFIEKNAPRGMKGARAAQFIDYDNDGLLDLIAVDRNGLVVLRNLGGRWDDAARAAIERPPGGGPSPSFSSFLSGDIDSDGDVDLVAFASDGGVNVLKNVGGDANNSEVVDLKGRVSNRSGIGSKIDMRAGSLSQKLESYSASPMPAPSEIHFGLGKRVKPDAVRIIWPSGVIQAETEFSAATGPLASRSLKVEELDRKPSSCPYLYTWNGEKFEFITDFMGGGESGSWQGDGERSHPDPDEFVRIPPDALKAKHGRYEIRVTNELEEVLFVDQLKLIAVEHDAEIEIYPNEGLGIPTAGQHIVYAVKGEHPPLAATDSRGRSVLPRIEKMDRDFYDSFDSTSIRGYAREHTLTLTLDDKKGHKGRTLLLLTGWTDYAFSSDNLAASQSGKSLFFPKLQVRDAKGDWRTVIDSIGIAVGRPQTVVVDLTGKFLTDSREVRIVTNVKTYWDKVAVGIYDQQPLKMVELAPVAADLEERGFSRDAKFGEMVVPNYDDVVADAEWKYFSGRFTRAGDVRPLLSDIDDVFLISKTGDEISLSFGALPDPPAGKKYTFLLFADGYSKEMDINSASPDVVLPLPFRSMSGYPYDVDEHFPMTAEKQRIYDEYTTRVVRGAFPRIESALLGPRQRR